VEGLVEREYNKRMDATAGPYTPGVPVRRSRLTLDERREQLLDVGISLFAEQPWEEISIEEIASAGGVSRGLLYHYFSGKREYYVACIEHAMARLHEVDPDPGLPAPEQLREGLERFFASIEAHPETHAALHRVSPADLEVAGLVRRDLEAFTDLVLAGLPRGGGGSPLARVGARAWLGAVDAAGMHWLEHRDVPPRQLVDILAHALVAVMSEAARIDPTIELPEGVAELMAGANGEAG
jgi:AcrR family transcriptional regulator